MVTLRSLTQLSLLQTDNNHNHYDNHYDNDDDDNDHDHDDVAPTSSSRSHDDNVDFVKYVDDIVDLDHDQYIDDIVYLDNDDDIGALGANDHLGDWW